MSQMKIMATIAGAVLLGVIGIGVSIPTDKPDGPLEQLGLPIPPGSCRLEPAQHRDRELIRQMRESGQGLGFRLESLFADCQSLEAWRVGKSSLASFGFYLESMENCGDCPPEAYVASRARLGAGEAHLALDQARAALRGGRSLVSLGILEQRDDAVILGYLSPGDRDGTTATLVLKVYFRAEGRDLVLNLTTILPNDYSLTQALENAKITVARAQHAGLFL